MGSDLTPDDVRRAQFRTAWRGLDADEVTAYLDEIAATLEELQADHDRVVSRLGEYADRDLESEFDTIGHEVAAVLQAAREAADAMRERAAIDAARWRTESTEEAEKTRKEARSDAEALRGDAWTAGSDLLSQTVVEAKRLREEAERDILTVMGEAEREAHRLISVARRESEDLNRAATMGSEKMTSEAAKRRDEMIESAQRQAEAAQERTRALEERREDLLEELENVRSTLGRLEGNLEERREDLNLSAPSSSSVKIVPSSSLVDPSPSLVDPSPETWEPGETVRIVSPGDEEPGAIELPEPEPEQLPEPEPEPLPDSEPSDSEPLPEPDSGTDDVSALFASLRGVPQVAPLLEPVPEIAIEPEPEPVAVESVEPVEESMQLVVPEPPPPSDSSELIDARDARLLPVTNRALRGVKKAVTDAQNIALDNLRTDNEWQPKGPAMAEMMRADLIGLWSESYSAGHQASEQMTGKKLRRKTTPSSKAADEFGDLLASAVSEALASAGEGQRDRQSATSGVFRAWRTDEAERRIRELALVGFHRGILESVGSNGTLTWVSAGTPCSACREAADDPASNPPPIHAGCECTLAIVFE